MLRYLDILALRSRCPRDSYSQYGGWKPGLLRRYMSIHRWDHRVHIRQHGKYLGCLERYLNLTKRQFGATVFSSYAAFNLTLAMIYLPGSGIIAAYIDPSSNQLTDEFHQALAMYLFAWMIPTMIYAVAAMRTNWILVLDLSVLSVEFLLLGCGNLLNNSSVLVAGNSLGFVVCFLTCKFPLLALISTSVTE